MSPPPTSRWRKRCWRCLRALRITVILLLFFIVAAGVYLNEVGLPGFLKRPLLKKLHERGLDLQFSRMLWHLNRGFVAEDVRFEPAEAGTSNPRLTIKEVELKVDHSALLKLQLVVNSLILHSGKLVWPAGETNGRPVELSLTNIQAQLRFLPGDQWELDHFTAAFGGGRLHFSGSVTNASSVRDWKLFQGGGRPPELAQRRLREFAETMEQMHFRAPPDLVVSINGDARDTQSFQGLLTLNARDARTPWGDLTNGTLVARLTPPDATNRVARIAVELRTGSAATPWGWATNGVMSAKLTAPDLTNYGAHVSFDVRADDAGTPWGSGRNFQMSLRGTRDENLTNTIRATLEIHADHLTNEWAQTDKAHLTVRWTHDLTNAIPLKGTVKLSLEGIQTRWANAGGLELTTRMDTPATAGQLHADDSWAWWAKLEPYTMNWNCELKDIRSPNQTNVEEFELKELACSGLWRAPQLTVTNLSVELYGGHFAVQVLMDVATRMVTFSAVSDFDVQKITPFLPEKSAKWLHKFSWENPPTAHTTGGAVLPAWTNQQPDWENEVLPTVWMQGDFKAGSAAYLGIPFNSVQSHFSLTNLSWNLPDLLATRPEGTIELAHTSDDRRDVFYFHVRSSVDPKILRPLLDADGQEGMDDFVFSEPPKVDGEIRGRWRDNSSLGFKAHVTATNLTFRNQTASSFVGDFGYTNQFMVLLNGRIERGARYMTATGLGVDFPGQRLFLTNGYSTMEQMPVARAISKKVTRTIEPYQFLQPPVVHAYGTIPLVDEVPADLHFKVEGGPFHWQRFNLEHVAGEVNWVGDHMTMTNARASFYKGDLAGSAAFNFAVDPGTDFSFDLTVTNADLHAMVNDLRASTNHLEGLFSGHLNITHANSDDWKSWFGSGEASLHDGLIWDIPIFGRFSPFLDKVHQGLGESRASEGSGKFVINNSIIHSDKVEIRSPTLHLIYRGNVDFGGNVDSFMEAEVLRDTPLVGGFISTLMLPFSKLFESKVTGTLDDPKVAPRFLVPKILNATIHPFRTLSDMFSNPSTNSYAAPVFQPPAPATQPAPQSPAPQPSPPGKTP
jgi:hypothetical protein